MLGDQKKTGIKGYQMQRDVLEITTAAKLVPVWTNAGRTDGRRVGGGVHNCRLLTFS